MYGDTTRFCHFLFDEAVADAARQGPRGAGPMNMLRQSPRAMPFLRIARLLCAIGIASLGAACATDPLPASAPLLDTVAAHDVAFSSLVANRRASVVDISTLRIGRDESPQEGELEFAPENDFADRLAWPLPASVQISQIRDLASGVILGADGLILTSAHVVSNIDEAQVRLDDGRRFTARVIGIDRRSDVALLKIQASGLPTAVIGDSARLSPGDWVAAIGTPFGFHGTVTTGVVSATNRFIGGAGEIPFIQTDVAINPGSSGSPLFNSRGEVVGINSMIYSGNGGYMGLSFAVPIDLVMKVVAQLRTDGAVRRSHLGADFQEVTPALADAFGLPEAAGALVVRVDADSPAQAAGLARGDVVMAFDGKKIAHFSQLLQLVSERPAHVRSRMDVWRRDTRSILWVSLGEQAPARPAAAREAADGASDTLGLELVELSPTLRLKLRIGGGLLVRDATGAARSEGIIPGDLVVAVNDDAGLEHVSDFTRALARATPGSTVALLVMRDRRVAYVPIRLPARHGKPLD